MDNLRLERACELAEHVRHVFVLTAGPDGTPHMATAETFVAVAGGIRIAEWFCPGTVENLRRNPRVAVVVWDQRVNVGYQIIGTAESVKDTAVVDGYDVAAKEDPHLPQVKRDLRVRVEKIMEFHHGPHSDVDPFHFDL